MGLSIGGRGELVDVTIVQTRNIYGPDGVNREGDYTLVALNNGERKFTKGHLGIEGDRIKINTCLLQDANDYFI